MTRFYSSRSAEILDESWDDNAQAWIRTVRDGQIESRRVATDQAILDAVLHHRPERILDVGCGEGWLCRALQHQGVTCIGVDGSSELIREARSADSHGNYYRLKFARFDRLQQCVGDASIDVAVCNFALLHEDISSILAAAHRVLRPGGSLVIQTVHPWTASEMLEYADGWRSEDFAWSVTPFPRPMPWYFRTLDSWVHTLRAHDFVLERLLEPAHPDSGKPLSLLIDVVRPGV